MKKFILATLIASLAIPAVAIAGNLISKARQSIRCVLAPHSHNCAALTTQGVEQWSMDRRRKVRGGKYVAPDMGNPGPGPGSGTRKYETTKDVE